MILPVFKDKEQCGIPVFHLHSPSDRMVSYSAGKTDDRIAKVSPFFTCTGIFLVLCNAKGAVLCLIFPLLYVLFGKYKEEPGKDCPLG